MAAMKHGTFYFRTLFALYVNFSLDSNIDDSSHQVYIKYHLNCNLSLCILVNFIAFL